MTNPEHQEIIDRYLEADPTPETSLDIVAQIAEDLGKPKNSIRMILSNAKVYVKKTAAATVGSKGEGTDKAPRRSKQVALEELTALIVKLGQDPNEEIIAKLTGKAADYLANVIREGLLDR